MNRSTLSESFGEQMKELTAGTIYEIEADEIDCPDIKMDMQESRIRSAMYDLWMCAHAKSLARSMEGERAAHYEDLYEFSYGVTRYDPQHFITKGTDSLALMIIDEKKSFSKRIEKLYKQYALFHSIMDSLDLQSSKLLVRYFIHGEKVDYETLREVLRKNLTKIEKVFTMKEREQEERADREEEEAQAAHGRFPVMVGRVKTFMTDDEYKRHKASQRLQSDDLMDRLGLL